MPNSRGILRYKTSKSKLLKKAAALSEAILKLWGKTNISISLIIVGEKNKK